MAGVEAIHGVGKGESLWAKADLNKKPVEENANKGLTAQFAPNGQNFLETVQSTFNSSGNNCAGI